MRSVFFAPVSFGAAACHRRRRGTAFWGATDAPTRDTLELCQEILELEAERTKISIEEQRSHRLLQLTGVFVSGVLAASLFFWGILRPRVTATNEVRAVTRLMIDLSPIWDELRRFHEAIDSGKHD